MWDFEECEFWWVNDPMRLKHLGRAEARVELGFKLITHSFEDRWFDDESGAVTYNWLVVTDWSSRKVIRRYTMGEIKQANQDYETEKWEHAEAYMPRLN